MKQHRFAFARKHIDCPYCGDRRSFKPYIDTQTEEQLPNRYGKCERIHSCGKWVKPWDDGFTSDLVKDRNQNVHSTPITQQDQKQVFIPLDVFKQTLEVKRYEQNAFVQNLLERVSFPFETTEIEKAVSLYRIGTITYGYMAGGTTFPFIDKAGNVCAIQVKKFDETNHTLGNPIPIHRLIEKYHKQKRKEFPTWLNDYLKQGKHFTCLFGEHLLNKYPSHPVGLVEAPKTAIYATLYCGFPDAPGSKIWLAPGSRDWFTLDRVKVLRGRDVYVYPDLSIDGSTSQSWKEKAWTFERKLPGTSFVVDTLLERNASLAARSKGADIGDYLIMFDPKEFRQCMSRPSLSTGSGTALSHQTKSVTQDSLLGTRSDKVIELLKDDEGWDLVYDPIDIEDKQHFKEKHNSNIVFGAWTKEIEDLDKFFKNVSFPPTPIKINPWLVIDNIQGFINANLEVARAQNGNPTYRPYLNRVLELMSFLTEMNE